MWNRLTTRKMRPAWAAFVVVLLLAVAMLFPQARAVASNFLGLFRVQQISVVQVDPSIFNDSGFSSQQFNDLLSQDVKFKNEGASEQVTNAAEASAAAGFQVRLPDKLSGTPKIWVEGSGQATLTINLAHVRAMLELVGRSDIQLPDNLDGSVVTVDIPHGVSAQYGSCYGQHQVKPDGTLELPSQIGCTVVYQMPSPEVNAPPDLDIQKLGEAYLQFLGMNQDQAAQFARSIDWASTFVIPIPTQGFTYREVPVDGVTGTLVEEQGSGSRRNMTLFWVKDGVVYSVVGRGSAGDLIDIANSLQ